MPRFLFYSIYSNTVMTYLLFLGCLIASFVVIKIIGHIVVRRLTKLAEKSKTQVNELLVKSIRRYVLPAAYFAAFYLNTKILVLGPTLAEIVNVVVLAFTTVMVALFASSAVVMLFNKYWEKKKTDPNKELAVKTVSGLLKIVIWSIAVILFLDNIGVKIDTLIAGIGIGGVAIAFAAQSILKDIFCFFTIFFDRPFEIGDFIVAGEQMGTVEHIGLKTTRLRALSGEQLIFSNTDLTDSRIQNYKTMEERRVLFTLGVTFDTPAEKLKEIPSLMKSVIESVPETKFGRCHFHSYGEYSLKYETAYYITSGDYDKYMDIHQQVNLSIFESFTKNGIAFALPAQTLHIKGEAKPVPDQD